MTATKSISQHSLIDTHKEWFEYTIQKINEALQGGKHLLAKGNTSGEMRDFYKSWMERDSLKMSINTKELRTQKYICLLMVFEYVDLLRALHLSLRKLALDVSGNKVLAWIEIQDNDQKTERTLLEVETKINAQFFADTKIFLDSMIVEQSDSLEVPPHYFIVSY